MNDTLRSLFRKTEEARTESEYAAVAAEAAKLLDNPSDYYQYRGYYFLDVDNPYFDPLLSEDAWKKAVETDNWFAPWVIANRYRDGSFGAVDLKSYEKYLAIATNKGFPAAVERQLSEALGNYVSSPEGSREKAKAADFIDQVLRWLEGRITSAMPVSFTVAQCYLRGMYVNKNSAQAITIFMEMIRQIGDGSVLPPPSVSSLFAVLRMGFFGMVDDSSHLEEAKHFLSLIPDAKGVDRSDLSDALDAQKIRRTLEVEASASADVKNRIAACKKFLLSIWSAGSDSDAQSFIDKAVNQGFSISDEIFIWYLNIVKEITPLFKWHRARVYNALTYRSEISHLGVTWEDVKRNTADVGVSFNTIKDSFPIVGTFTPPKESGFTSIDGIEVDGNGLRVIGERSQKSGLVFERDIVDALAFAYGSKECVWPSLSIEPIGTATADSNLLNLRRKVFYPTGFGATEIGKTFFRTDWLLAREHVFDPEFIRSENPDVPNGVISAAKFLHDGFKGLGGVSVGLWGRVMLRPDNVEIVREQIGGRVSLFRSGRSGIRFSIKSLNVFVDGAGCIDVDKNTSIRNIYQNDPRFASGRLAKYWTDNMPLIKELLPVFARLEQIYRLLAMLGYMRENAVEIPDHVRSVAIQRAEDISISGSTENRHTVVLP